MPGTSAPVSYTHLVNKQTSLDEMLQELEQEMNLQPMEKPSFTNKENSTYPAIMTYDEYLRAWISKNSIQHTINIANIALTRQAPTTTP